MKLLTSKAGLLMVIVAGLLWLDERIYFHLNGEFSPNSPILSALVLFLFGALTFLFGDNNER